MSFQIKVVNHENSPFYTYSHIWSYRLCGIHEHAQMLIPPLLCVYVCVCISYAFVYKQQLYLQVNNTRYTFSQREKQQNKNKTNKAKEPHTTQTFVPFHRLLVFLHRDMRLPGSSCPSALYHLTLRVKCSLCFFSLFFFSSLIHTKIISRKLGWV